MENETKKGKKKIEMKLIESERARAVSFSKRKKTLFEDAKKFATQTGRDVGVRKTIFMWFHKHRRYN